MIDTEKFLTLYTYLFPSLKQTKGLLELVELLSLDLRWTLDCLKAYALATVLAECGPSYLPVPERGSFRYFTRYDAGTVLGKQLGNTLSGDGFKFRGRGYVQLTGRYNYSLFSHKVGEDLLNNPDLALNPKIAFEIMSAGMLEGLFTGKRLGDFVSEEAQTYILARQVINSQDRAIPIAENARKFLTILTESFSPKVLDKPAPPVIT